MGRCSSFTSSIGLPFLLLAIILISGCNRKTMVVLVPDLDGKTGAVNVSNDAGAVDIDTANQATTISGRQSAPKAPEPMTKEEIEAVFSRALAAQPKPPVHFILYFISDSNELQPESLESLTAIFQTSQERGSVDISVIGHTDTIGSDEYNYKLAEGRAETVATYLVGRGVDQGHIRVSSHGERNPLIPTGDNVNEPRNRRVEVVVR
jgi:outer membrane protein OmpA-like peptidoglycan-associated protein